MAPSMPPVNPKSKIQNPKSPDPWGAGINGPSPAVPELPADVARDAGATEISVSGLQAKIAQGYTMVMGASGTPITGGFLVDLGEFNRKMMGLNAVKNYEKMVRSDGQVRGLLNALEWPIQEARWTIEPVPDKDLGPGQTKGKAKEVSDFVRENLMGGMEWRTERGGWASQSFKEVLKICLDYLTFGCKVAELVHTVDGAKLRLRRIADREPLTYYRWHTDPSVVDPTLPANVYDDGETLQAVQQYGYRGSKFITPILPVDKILRITFNQRGANFWGIPPTRAMYPDWFLKSTLKRIDAICCERTSLGVPVILLPPGASAQDKTAAYNFVTQLAAHEKAGLVLPSGSKFEIVGTEGHLKEIIPSMEYADMQMARSINAMFMNIGGQRGMGSGRAQSESQTNFFALGLQAVADQIAMTIRNDVVRPLVAMNFGEDAPVPMVGAENVQARGLEQKAQIISQLAQQGAWVSDRGSINQDRHELGYPEFENTDLVLARGVTIQGVNDPVTVQSQMPQEQGTGHSGQGTEPGSQKSKGKSQNAKLAAEEVDGARLSVTGKNFRTFKSDYWPEPVHPSQAHIDFASIQQAMATGEDRIAAILKGPARAGVIDDIAAQAVAQLKDGKRPSELTFAHDEALEAALETEIKRVYDVIRKATRREFERQWRAKFNSEFRIQNSELLSSRPEAPAPELIAEGTVQEVVNRFAAAARNLANDLEEDEFTDDVFVNALHRLADSNMDRIAAEASRDAMRDARADEFGDAGIGAPPDVDLSDICEGGEACRCMPYADLTESPVVWRRSALLDQNTCGPCMNADGAEI